MRGSRLKMLRRGLGMGILFPRRPSECPERLRVAYRRVKRLWRDSPEAAFVFLRLFADDVREIVRKVKAAEEE